MSAGCKVSETSYQLLNNLLYNLSERQILSLVVIYMF